MNSLMEKELEILMGLSSNKENPQKIKNKEFGIEHNEADKDDYRLKSTSTGLFSKDEETIIKSKKNNAKTSDFQDQKFGQEQIKKIELKNDQNQLSKEISISIIQDIINKIFKPPIIPFHVKKCLTKKKSNLTELLKSESTIDNIKSSKPNLQLKIFVLETREKFKIFINDKITIKAVIKAVVEEYNSLCLIHNWKGLSYPNNPDYYELRILDEDEDDEFSPLEEIGPLDSTKIIGEVGLKSVALSLKHNIAETNNSNINYKSLEINSNKVFLKVIAKIPEESVLNLLVTSDMTLLEVLQKISNKIGIQLQENKFLFAINCQEMSNISHEDLTKYHKLNNQNILNLKMKVKDLGVNELLLLKKIYADLPQSPKRSFTSNARMSFKSVWEAKAVPLVNSNINTMEEEKKNSLLTNVLGFEYIELFAQLIENQNQKRNIICGIDGSNLYITDSGIFKLNEGNKYNLNFINDIRIQRISLKSIGEIQPAIYDKKKLYIFYTNSSNTQSRLDMEFNTIEDASCIYEKIKFLAIK